MTTPTLLTTAQVAAILGLDPAHVRHLARQHGIGQHHGRDWLFVADDVDRLRDRPVGAWPKRKAAT